MSSQFIKSFLFKYIPGVFSPFYHAVSSRPRPHIDPLYTVLNPDEFIGHLDQFQKYFEFIDLNQTLSIIQGDKWRKKKTPAFLSFDDGLIECTEIIAPILHEKGIPATFFVNPSFIDTDDIFFRYKVALLSSAIRKNEISSEKIIEVSNYLKENQLFKSSLIESILVINFSQINVLNELIRLTNIKYRNRDIYMSKNDIISLLEKGHSIGAHSMSHPMFSELSFDEQRSEILDSLDYVQNEFARQKRVFAFPFYDFDLDRKLFDLMFNELNVDLSFGTSGFNIDVDSRIIQRLDMEKCNGSATSYVRKKVLYYIVKKMTAKHKMKR